MHSSGETFFLNFLSCSCDSCLARLARDSGAMRYLEFFICCCGEQVDMSVLSVLSSSPHCFCFRQQFVTLIDPIFVFVDSSDDTFVMLLKFSMLDLLLGGEHEEDVLSEITSLDELSNSSFFRFLFSSVTSIFLTLSSSIQSFPDVPCMFLTPFAETKANSTFPLAVVFSPIVQRVLETGESCVAFRNEAKNIVSPAEM